MRKRLLYLVLLAVFVVMAKTAGASQHSWCYKCPGGYVLTGDAVYCVPGGGATGSTAKPVWARPYWAKVPWWIPPPGSSCTAGYFGYTTEGRLWCGSCPSGYGWLFSSGQPEFCAKCDPGFTYIVLGGPRGGARGGGRGKGNGNGKGRRAGKRFPNPTVNGMRVDLCLHWAQQCGKPAADAFCRLSGYGGSSAHQVVHDRPPTYVIGDKKVCNQGFCDGFSSITCVGAATARPQPQGKCQIEYQSYGGSKACLIRHQKSGYDTYTVLTVHEGKEVQQSNDFLSTFAKGGSRIGGCSTFQSAKGGACQRCSQHPSCK
jgi:hypothetical protein